MLENTQKCNIFGLWGSPYASRRADTVFEIFAVRWQK